MTESHPNRRDGARVPMVLSVDYPDRDEFLTDWTENLSAGGLFVRTREGFSTGEVVRLCVSFPSLLEPAELTGRVAWIRPPSDDHPGGIGVQVVTDVARRRLAELALLATRAASSPSQTYRMLFVEDNEQMIKAMTLLLQRSNVVKEAALDVVFARDGLEAIEQLERTVPNLVVTDLYMPRMDGFALIRKIRATPTWSSIPVLALTGGTADEDVKCREIGADGFLRKPVALGELLETISRLLGVRARAKLDA